LGTVDMFGTKFETNHIVTGMASKNIYKKLISAEPLLRIIGILNVMKKQLSKLSINVLKFFFIDIQEPMTSFKSE
jgi:hypothetical protein